VRRPKDLRRGVAVDWGIDWAIDRRVAVVAVVVGAIALSCTAAAVRSPAPVAAARRDPAAARELVARMRAGERASWLATYDFTRTLADGRVLRQTMREGRKNSLHVLMSGSAMTVERGNRTFECNLVTGQSSCHATPGGRSLPASEVLRVAVAVGAYDVTVLPSETIADEDARCFRVRATGSGQLTDLGTETDLCLFDDGVPARQRVERSTGAIDQRDAHTVKRGVSTAAIDALERSFAPGAPAGNP